MKKGILKVGILGCGLFLLTGCGNNGKVLTCTASEGEDDTFQSHMTLNFTFNTDGTELQKVDLTAKLDAPSSVTEDELKELDADDLCDSFEGQLATCNASRNGRTFTLTGSIATDNLSDMFSDLEGTPTYNEMKEAAEDEGFTCK